MKIRPAGSGLSLDEAMNKVEEIQSLEELKEKIKKEWSGYYDENTIQFKDYGYDSRIGWQTYLICMDRCDGSYTGCAVYFADGRF